uniref:Uncharacterized protein n=1 Tax=Arundo donax TaxID=35708 RepID=A0A0A9HM55_ARUDO
MSKKKSSQRISTMKDRDPIKMKQT